MDSTVADRSAGVVAEADAGLPRRPDLIRAPAAIRDLLAQFSSVDNVLGARLGTRRRNGKSTGEIAVVVLVRRKLPRDKLKPHEVLPGQLLGLPVDVRQLELPRTREGEHPVPDHEDLAAIDWPKVHRLHLRSLQKKPAPAPPIQTAVVGQVFVMEDNGTFTTTQTGFSSIDWVGVYQAFLTFRQDDYDFVAFYPDKASGMPDIGAAGWGGPISNEAEGIGLYVFNGSGSYGSARLQGFTAFNQYPSQGPFVRLQEFGHRWGAYAKFRDTPTGADRTDLLRTDLAHWSDAFDDDVSAMDYDGFDWVANADGTFTKRYFTAAETGYCPLDLYLMGMLLPSQVPGFFWLSNITGTPDPTRFNATRNNLTIDNVRWAMRPGGSAAPFRSPDATNSYRAFRQVFLVLTKQLAQGTTYAAQVDTWRKSHADQMRTATRSRAVLDTYLYADPYDGIYIQDNPTDTGIEPSTGAFWNSQDIWIRNADDAGTSHQDTIRGVTNYARVRVHNKSTTASGEITVNLYRANYVGTEFLYPEDWNVDNRIGSVTIASIPAGGSSIAKFTWPAAMIPDATWHPCLLAEVVPIHRTLAKLRHVWDDRRLAQKNITIVGPSPLPFHLPFRAGSLAGAGGWTWIKVRQVEGPQASMIAVDLGTIDWSARIQRRIERTMPTPVALDGEKAAGDATPTVRFLSGARVSVELADSVLEVALAAGSRIDLSPRMHRLPTQAGRLTPIDGRPHFVLKDRVGAVALPFEAGELHELGLRLEGTPDQDCQFEVTQLNATGEVVGGFDLRIERTYQDDRAATSD